MRSTLRALATVATAALLLGLLATGAAAQSGGQVNFRGQIDSLNDSGGSGDVIATLDTATNQLTVRINGSGFVFQPHAQHIHGVQAGESTCPGPDVDDDGDGFTSTPEAQPNYGPIQASLTTEGDTSPDSALAVERFPTYEDSSYERTFEVSSELANDLQRFHIVIHGVDVNGNGEYDMDAAGPSPLNEDLPFEATMPAACGTLSATAAGGVQTGAGGTATSGSGPLALLALGGLTIAGLGLRVRRSVTG